MSTEYGAAWDTPGSLVPPDSWSGDPSVSKSKRSPGSDWTRLALLRKLRPSRLPEVARALVAVEIVKTSDFGFSEVLIPYDASHGEPVLVVLDAGVNPNDCECRIVLHGFPS